MILLAKKARVIREKYGLTEAAEGRPVVRERFVELQDHERRPTLEEMRLNNERLAQSLFSSWPDQFSPQQLTGLLPMLEKADPSEFLRAASAQLRKEFSPANRLLVKHAINQLIAIGEPDEGTEKLVRETIALLAETEERKADYIWARLYQHSYCGGWSIFCDLSGSTVYSPVPRLTGRYNDAISSLEIGVDRADKGEVILFEHQRFQGRYARFSGTSGTTVRTNYVGDFINDRTSSILIVRRFNREVSFALGSPDMRARIETHVANFDRISMRGSPIITWDMYPDFAPTRCYIYLRIPVRVDVPHWPDYDAEIRYHIFLDVDTAGSLYGYVDRYSCWVEGGIKSDSIADQIERALPGTLPIINEELQRVLALASMVGPLERVYYLPGNAGTTGHTEDNVTVVLVRK